MTADETDVADEDDEASAAGEISDDKAGGEVDADLAEGDEPVEGHSRAGPTSRTTAPQSRYTPRDVLFGFVVALVGLAVVFGVPLALTL